MKKHFSINDVENILHHLNYRWNLQSLALWKGVRPPFSAHGIYEGYEAFISRETIGLISDVSDSLTRTRLSHGLIDHYLQRTLLPHEAETRTWMKGAAAEVEGKKIYFRDIISWCQKSSTYDQRQTLQKETASLLKFLKPFVLNHWRLLLKTLKERLGFEDYLDYCSRKKGIDYGSQYRFLKAFLEETDELYFSAMDRWSREALRRPVEALTRFDAIHLLSMAQFDSMLPVVEISPLASAFFSQWSMDLSEIPGLELELGKEEGKSAQAMCFILQVPDEVYVVMKPEGGWIDLETLWHELGHGLSAVLTSPRLSLVERDLSTSFSLSESFAFLLQNITFSPPFLQETLRCRPDETKRLTYYKALKDFSLFRRYAAKFLAEYRMFTGGDLSDGGPYAEIMRRYTGFYYQPESHLFDLVPEFYSLDYVQGWMAEAIMERTLRDSLGDRWMHRPEASEVLRSWWAGGNRVPLSAFIEKEGMGLLSHEALRDRWQVRLSGGP